MKNRLLHVGLALSFIFILIVSLTASSVISAMTNREFKTMASTINILVSIFSYIAVFTLTFRYMPDHHQPWQRAIRGGLLTAVLFVFGKELIGLYLGRSAIGSAYGAAGSLVVLLVWVYYSTLITFVGAQVSSLISHKARHHRLAEQ
jgi:membrane protein